MQAAFLVRCATLACAIALACPGLRAQDLRGGAAALMIEDPQQLQALEAAGYGFGAVFDAGAGGNQSLHAASSAYRDITARISADVKEIEADMAANKRKLFKVTDGNVGRIMDLEWLTSPIARYQLAAVVNRLDRRDFHALQGEQTCGEVRFIYRLAYLFEDRVRRRRLASRLPFNFNVVYTVARGQAADCAAAAKAFTPAGTIAATRAAAWLAAGPLARSRLQLKQIELNAQVVRFPSGMETEFGGQAVYLMRIFNIAGGRATEKPLENTPDVTRLGADAEARKKLVDFVKGNLAAIDRGVFSIPEELLAKKALSYSTFGSARLANHMFSQTLREADFAGVSFAGLTHLRTPRALLERLDNTTCSGCHQANATAGFHVIGRDAPEVPAINRVKVGISAHLHAELARRHAYVEAVARGAAPDVFRPLSLAPAASWSGAAPAYQPAEAGMPCLQAQDAQHFGGAWTCSAGTTCQVIARDAKLALQFGQCLATREQDMFSGHPCLEGDIQSNARPYLDRFKIGRQFAALSKTISDRAYSCRPPKIGVPGGIAYRKCTDEDRIFAKFSGGKAPAEICGFAGGQAFDDCVATNDFAACLGGAVVRGNRPTCSAERFCREDYMCQELPGDTPFAERVSGYGYCSPTYFLFQMRIDGHPDPRGKIPVNGR